MGSSSVSIQAYIAEVLDKERNTFLINRISLVNIAGMFIGPLLSLGIFQVNIEVLIFPLTFQ